jgi:RNA polymerase-associated protein RTF1
MDESDSDAAPNDYLDTADDDNPYPVEGKYKNLSDKAYVLGLTEVEREQLLADRAEEAQSKRRGQQLKSLLDSSAADKSKKRKAATELEDERRPARAKTTREKALDAYKTTREQARESRRKGLGRGARRSRSRSDASSRDASGSPDVQTGSASHSKELDLAVELADVERIRVGRSRLAQVCFFPRFDESMIGCFARVCIGLNADRQNEYRMAVIKGIVTGQPYLVDASPAVPVFYTDQYVLCAHGKSQKQWAFNNCSDSKFTEREFNRWKQQLTVTDNIPLTTRAEANKACDKINALLNHRLTNEEVNEKVAKRDKFRHLFQSSTSSPKPTKSDDMAEKLMRRNEKARKETSDQIRRVQAAKELKRRRAMEIKKAEHSATTASNGGAADSLAVPKNDIDALFSEGSDISRAASPALSALKAPAMQRSGTSTPQKHKPGRFAKMTMDDDIISSMELAIDIEI